MFGEPTVNQYNSHMVMTGVIRPTKTQYINIDTKFRESVNTNGSTACSPELASCHITLPQRVSNVKSIAVRDAEIPMTFYNISQALGNNVFYAWHTDLEQAVITLDDGEYTLASLKTEINAKISASSLASLHLTFDYSATTNKTWFTTTNTPFTIAFNIDSNGDSTGLVRSLGWALGFRQPSYDMLTRTVLPSESVAQLQTHKYLYLVLDEFSRGNIRSFMASPDIRRQIIAKIVLNRATYPFGTVLPANNYNGYLLTDTRQYQGEIDLLRMKVELVDDLGRVVDLNGADFAFTLEVTAY